MIASSKCRPRNSAGRFRLTDTPYQIRSARLQHNRQVSFPLVVRYGGDNPSSIDEIRRTQIDTPVGAKVPLSLLAEITEDRGPNFIMREGVQRRIVVQCNVAGRDLRSVVNEIQSRIA